MKTILIALVLALITACSAPLDGVRTTDRLEPNFSKSWGSKPLASGEDCPTFGVRHKRRDAVEYTLELHDWYAVNEICQGSACFDVDNNVIHIDNTDDFNTWQAFYHEWCHAVGYTGDVVPLGPVRATRR